MEDEGNEESVEQLTDGIRMGDGGGNRVDERGESGWQVGGEWAFGGRWAAGTRRWWYSCLLVPVAESLGGRAQCQGATEAGG